MQVHYEVFFGCDNCGDNKYLDPENYFCNKCLIKGIKADLEGTKDADYLDASFKASQIEKHTNRLNLLLVRLEDQIKAVAVAEQKEKLEYTEEQAQYRVEIKRQLKRYGCNFDNEATTEKLEALLKYYYY
jgi:hypothetical protein